MGKSQPELGLEDSGTSGSGGRRVCVGPRRTQEVCENNGRLCGGPGVGDSAGGGSGRLGLGAGALWVQAWRGQGQG